MIRISDYIQEFPDLFAEDITSLPWNFISVIQSALVKKIQSLSPEFTIKGNIAIHKTATIEEHAILKGPLIISQNCFVAAHAYLRNGVYLGNSVSLGPGCEVKSSCIFSHSNLAHFNFVGDSLIGSRINMEAGAVIANHFNEWKSKKVEVVINGKQINTGVGKFGALVGDRSRVGANAVLSRRYYTPAQKHNQAIGVRRTKVIF